MGLGTAFRAFFVALGSGPRATRIREVLDGKEAEDKGPSPGALPAPVEKKPDIPLRSEALSLLSALQREARLVDLVKEPLDAFSDAQIGAAARPCLKQCAQVIERMFQVHGVSEAAEGDTMSLPEAWSPVRYQVIGDSVATSGSAMRVVHPGWQARICSLPQWTGDPKDVLVIAPAQLESAR